jgi:cysteinyl-tRNA synthetase
MLEITGLCQKNNVQTKIVDYEIDKLVKERNEFRKIKEFEKADNIRKILAGKGIGIIDNNNGTSSWEKL